MARKPLSELSPAYRRRIERAQAAGKSRQAARGHKLHEHVERKAKEIEKRGVSNAQLANIRNFANRQAKRGDADPAHVFVRMKTYVKEHGYTQFIALRDTANSKHRQYLGEQRRKAYTSRGMESLEHEQAEFDAPDFWFFYH